VKWYIFQTFFEKTLLNFCRYIVFCFAFASILLWTGCSPAQHAVHRQEKGSDHQAELDSLNPMAVRHVIDGSVFEMKGDYANAILEYQDALRFSKAPAIFHALGKNYSALGRHALAIESGREAVRLAPENLEYHRSLAEVYVAAFQLDSAAEQYEQIIRRDSSDVQVLFSLGRLYEPRKPLRALEIYDRMMQHIGPDWTVLLQVAELYNKLGQLDKAAAALQKMKDLDPSNQPLQRTLAQTYVRAQHYDEALKILSNLHELDPSNLEYLGDIGSVYLLQKNYAKAAEQFEPILERDTLSVDAKIKIGQLYYDQIEKDSTLLPLAKKFFERIQLAHPKDWRPYWFLGAIASMMHNDSIAIGRFRTLTDLAPWNPDGWVFLASAYFGKNDYARGAEILENGCKHVPEDFRVNFFLGVAYNRLGRLTEAAHALEKARKINPKDLEAIAELAIVYDGLKRHEESDSLYEGGLRQKPDYHLMLNNYGYSLAERGLELERALDMATRAVEADSNNASYLDTKAWVYYRLGRYQEAEKYLTKALEKGQPSATVYDHMGDIAFKLKDRERAMEYWKKAQVLDPNNTEIRNKIERGSL
jgi:tetratricopeptide (TPR) repeat protein